MYHYSRREWEYCNKVVAVMFLLVIFLCSLIPTLTLTTPNNALLANLDMYGERALECQSVLYRSIITVKVLLMHGMYCSAASY